MQLAPLKLLVTGASGFVGRAFCAEAIARGLSVVAVTRKATNISNVQVVLLGNIHVNTDWQATLMGCDVVVHLAARVHVMDEHSAKTLQAFLDVNCHATMSLAKQAVAAGIKRFVYVSSIKVNGEFTETKPFSEKNQANPQDSYAVSKWQGEQALLQLAKETDMEVVIIRPPLVYGEGVKANFLSLLHAVNKSLPLPVGSIYNRRRMIYVGNLVDMLITCARHPVAAGQTYLVSDAESVSTPNLIRNLAKVLGRRCFVFPFPIFILRFLAKLLGKSTAVDRLTQSLEMDNSKVYNELGWKPPYTMQQGLQATADWYLQSINNKI